MTQPHLDPVSVLIAFAAGLMSERVAAVAGPYAVIWIASTLGAYYALGSREPTSRSQGVKFFLAVNATALLLTVPLSLAAKPYLPDNLDERWIFGHMALCIGLVGDRWPKVFAWLVSFFRSRVARAGDQGEKS